MKTYSLRATGNAGVKDLFLSGEYAKQDKPHTATEDAWYLEAGWTFSDAAWTPYVSYRYSRFSEGYDTLFYGFSRGFGTWFQGEVAGNYAGPFNTNSRIQQLKFTVTPLENLTVGAMYFNFDTIDRNLGNTDGHEVDLYAEWHVNDHLTRDAADRCVPAGQERRPGRYAAGQQRPEPLQPGDFRHHVSKSCRGSGASAAPVEKGISNAQKIPHDPEQDHPARRPLPGVGGGFADGLVALPDAPEQPASGPGQQRNARRRRQGTHAGPGQSAGHASATHLHADPRIRPGFVAVSAVPAGNSSSRAT